MVMPRVTRHHPSRQGTRPAFVTRNHPAPRPRNRTLPAGSQTAPTPRTGAGDATKAPPTEPGDTTPQPPATGTAALKQAIADAQKAYEEGQTALKKNDWAAYGKAQADLQAALERAAAAQSQAPGAPPSKPGG